MDAEITDRILECLRKLDVGESISADGIADEIGEKLSDVYDALEDLENAKLAQMHVASTNGGDPTYTLTPKGKRAMKKLPSEPQAEPEHTEAPANDCACQYCGTVMASPARKRNHEPVCAKNPDRNSQKKELTLKGQKAQGTKEHNATEPRPSADRVCRFCGKIMEPNKLRRHENCCGKNPDRPRTQPKFFKTATVTYPGPVPAPAEYAETESNATATIEHEIPEVLEQLNAEDPEVPDEVPLNEEAGERVARLVQAEAMVLKGSPGLAAVLRIISECQKAIAEGADVHLSASIVIAPGLDVSVYLVTPVKQEGSDE